MDWDRVNVWTNTLYTLIQSLEIARGQSFGDLADISDNIRGAARWTPQVCSYQSILVAEPFGNHKVTFRRDPNRHFHEISAQLIKMLVMDLTVILDEMATEALVSFGEAAGGYPQSRIEKLARRVRREYRWAANGCLELIAVRNALTHNGGKWNEKSIGIIKQFVTPLPIDGDALIVGFPMLFRYRKAMRTFLNEVLYSSRNSIVRPIVAQRATPKRIRGQS